MNPTEFKLDEWDFQLILTFKRQNDLNIFDQLRSLWGKRNGADPKRIELFFIVDRLEEIRLALYSISPANHRSALSVMIEVSPYKQEMYYKDYTEILSKMTPDESYWARLILAYGPIMRFCESKDVPGLSEYFENVWKKAGKP